MKLKMKGFDLFEGSAVNMLKALVHTPYSKVKVCDACNSKTKILCKFFCKYRATKYSELTEKYKHIKPKERVNNLKTIKIKYLRDIEKIKSIAAGDWIDLRAAEDVAMKKDNYAMIPLGVAMELPEGYEAIVLPRSSTFKKYGVILVNSMGVIDESYKGDNDEWNFLAYALHDTIIPKNERICQFRIIEHQPKIELCEVETLGNPDRGGIGSTGRV